MTANCDASIVSQKALAFLFFTALSLGVSGCGGGGASPTSATPEVPTLPVAALTFIQQPTSSSVQLKSTATLNVVVSGAGSLTYQWYYRGVAILDATKPAYSIPIVSASDAGDYFVVISSSNGKVTSNTVTLTVAGSDPSGAEKSGRVFVTAKAGRNVKMPSWDKSWQLKYQFVVPPLPTSSWDPSQMTLYIWGDIAFDAYGTDGKFKISDYKFNQIVPQLFLGRVLSNNDAAFKPAWTQQNTWAIQAQYYWQKDSTSYAQTGPIINVSPGEIITTAINYTATDGKITASISAPGGISTIVLARPFPNEPGLFADWSSFFKASQAKSANELYATPELNVEPDADKQSVCTVLPFTIRSIDMPSIGNMKDLFAQYVPAGFSCSKPMVVLDF